MYASATCLTWQSIYAEGAYRKNDINVTTLGNIRQSCIAGTQWHLLGTKVNLRTQRDLAMANRTTTTAQVLTLLVHCLGSYPLLRVHFPSPHHSSGSFSLILLDWHHLFIGLSPFLYGKHFKAVITLPFFPPWASMCEPFVQGLCGKGTASRWPRPCWVNQ